MKRRLQFFTMLLLAGTHSLPAREIHVSVTGNNANDGSFAKPLRSIQVAANMAMPGDVITVHAGTYREQITPPRGGNSDTERIVYQAAKGEKVEIKGSEIIKHWQKLDNDTWMAEIPNSFFGKFNPYSDLIRGDWFNPKGRNHHTGAVYLNGDWLMEAAKKEDVMRPAAENDPLWWAEVDSTVTTIWAQFKNGNPNTETAEINVRQTLFYPDKPFINFITVRGFVMQHAATNWAPPTAEQMGLIGTHWSRGWIIENNAVQYSKCVGIALGKYGDAFDNKSAESAEGYVGTINRALAFGWNKGTIGGHIVRNNTIAHCEQAGVVGSMGCAFSTVQGNTIHDIHIRKLFSGAEMAGIKFHGAIDVQITNNQIYRSDLGIWLDWMAQGAQVKNNLLYDNLYDLFLEMNHGPILVSNNIMLSDVSLIMNSKGVAFAHNLFGGRFNVIVYDTRFTPSHRPHSTFVDTLHSNEGGDVKFFNNLFVNKADASEYAKAFLPVIFDGNVFAREAMRPVADRMQQKFGELDEARRKKLTELKPLDAVETNSLVKTDSDAAARLTGENGQMFLTINLNKSWLTGQIRSLVTSETLGKALIPGLPFEDTDGKRIQIDRDYSGRLRNLKNPSPGPFEITKSGLQKIKVW